MGVAIGEQARLEHLVGTRPHARHHVAGVESRLFHLGEIVVGKPVERQPPDLHRGVVLVGPDLGEVEGIHPVFGCVDLRHDLHFERPGRVIAPLDGPVEGVLQMPGFLARNPRRFLRRQAFDALVGLEVELHPDALAGGVDPLEGVGAVAVHVPPAARQAPVAEKPCELVRSFRRMGEEVPRIVGFLPVAVRIGLLRVDEVRELQRVADEEHRRVVAGEVPIAVFRVELDGEAARVAHGIGRAPGAGEGGEPREDLGALAGLREHAHPRPAGRIRIGDFEDAIGAGAHRMDDPFRYALAVEAGELLDQMLVLEQERAAGAGALAVPVVGHRGSGLGGEVVGTAHVVLRLLVSMSFRRSVASMIPGARRQFQCNILINPIIYSYR